MKKYIVLSILLCLSGVCRGASTFSGNFVSNVAVGVSVRVELWHNEEIDSGNYKTFLTSGSPDQSFLLKSGEKKNIQFLADQCLRFMRVIYSKGVGSRGLISSEKIFKWFSYPPYCTSGNKFIFNYVADGRAWVVLNGKMFEEWKF